MEKEADALEERTGEVEGTEGGTEVGEMTERMVEEKMGRAEGMQGEMGELE